jgi:hypothetical protein
MSNLSCQTAIFSSPWSALDWFAASGQSRKDACFTVADPPTGAFGCLRWMGTRSVQKLDLIWPLEFSDVPIRRVEASGGRVRIGCAGAKLQPLPLG